MTYTDQEIKEIRKLKQKQIQYLKEIEPLVKLRVDLAMRYQQICLIQRKGMMPNGEYFCDDEVRYSYEPEIQKLDDQLKYHIELIKTYYFGDKIHEKRIY